MCAKACVCVCVFGVSTLFSTMYINYQHMCPSCTHKSCKLQHSYKNDANHGSCSFLSCESRTESGGKWRISTSECFLSVHDWKLTCNKTCNYSELVLPVLTHVASCSFTTALLLSIHVCFASLYAVKTPNGSKYSQGHFGPDWRLPWMLWTVLCFHPTQFSALQET